MSGRDEQIYDFGGFRLKTEDGTLWRGEDRIAVTQKSIELLTLLVENQGRVVTRNEIIEKIWADTFVDENNLSVTVSMLRKALANTPESANLIETIPRKGYRFNGEVAATPDAQRYSEHEFIRTVIENTQIDAEVTTNAIARLNRRTSRQTLYLAGVAVGIMLLAGILGWSYLRKKDALSSPSSRTLAVLPFRDLSADERGRQFSIGLADSLITKLAGIRGLSVRPMSAVLPFAASQDSPQKIGENLKVETVLDGTIQRAENRLRVSLQLIDTASNQVIWAGSFEEQEQNLFKFQDAFPQNITEALRFKLSGEQQSELARRDTENPEAYRLYLTARYFFSQNRGDSIVKAVELYEQAVKLDDRYALAYTGIGESYIMLGESAFGALPPAEAYQKATVAVQKALSINPNLAEAYMILGNAQIKHEWNIEAGDIAYRKTIALSPNFARVHLLLAWNLIRQSRFEEAEIEMRRAAELNPTSLEIAAESGYPAFFAGDYNKAILLFGQAVEFDKNLISARLSLCRALQHAGRYGEAWAEVEAVEKNVGRGIPLIEMVRGRTLALQGKTTAAQEIYETLVSRRQKGEYISPLYLAILSADLNNREAVFGWLAECYAERNDYLLQLSYAPEFIRLHDDPRYQDLLAKIKPFPPD